MTYLYFLNLQYWYCVIYSLFGGGCTYLDQLREQGVDVPFDGISGTGTGNAVAHVGFFTRLGDTFAATGSFFWHPIAGAFSFIWHVYSALAWGVSAFLFFAILSALAGLVYIRIRDVYAYGTLPPEEEKKDDPQKHRWQELLDYTKSKDPKLWRQAILEADHMLGELLGGLGYGGVNTAEKMRLLPEGAFVTVPVAWEAHRIRNFVAQGASDFILTQREAFRVMKLYEQVFEEFNFI